MNSKSLRPHNVRQLMPPVRIVGECKCAEENVVEAIVRVLDLDASLLTAMKYISEILVTDDPSKTVNLIDFNDDTLRTASTVGWTPPKPEGMCSRVNVNGELMSVISIREDVIESVISSDAPLSCSGARTIAHEFRHGEETRLRYSDLKSFLAHTKSPRGRDETLSLAGHAWSEYYAERRTAFFLDDRLRWTCTRFMKVSALIGQTFENYSRINSKEAAKRLAKGRDRALITEHLENLAVNFNQMIFFYVYSACQIFGMVDGMTDQATAGKDEPSVKQCLNELAGLRSLLQGAWLCRDTLEKSGALDEIGSEIKAICTKFGFRYPYGIQDKMTFIYAGCTVRIKELDPEMGSVVIL